MALPEVEFCSRCFTLFESLRDDVEWSKSWAHYSTYGQLSVSSTTCFLCQLFIASLLPDLKRFEEDASPNLDEYPFESNVLSAREMRSHITWTHLQILGQVSIEDNISMIASWFHECCINHAHIDDRWEQSRPRRLLSVGLDEKPMRLVRTDTIADTAPYATLSYCWGQSPHLRTSKDSIKQFMEAVPAKLLPATYNEFIKIARALAIPYVWIDALCIIQDDEEEWQNEAAHMGDIFQGSIFTIAAAQSSDTSEGCFPVRERIDLNNGALLHVRQQETEKPVILTRIYKGDTRQSSLQGSILSERGWTLQEQLLSPRIVSCIENEVHWESDKFALNLQILVPFEYPALEEDRQSNTNIWHRIVENYTERRFMYKTDRVSAIAGGNKNEIAERMGLPSWTWFGYQGDLSYTLWTTAGPDVLEVQHTKLLYWDIKWTGVDNASAVQYTRIHIKGPVRDIPLASFDEGQKVYPPYLYAFGESVDFRGKTQVPWRCCGELDDRTRMKPSTYFCLFLFSCHRNSDKIDEIFLILESVDNSDTSTFRRIGLGRIRGSERTFNINNQMSISLV
ncbi:HET-domain-containing protein [Xylaria longipes]|nr:HET-domain-containing protein [Xylaria longipes]